MKKYKTYFPYQISKMSDAEIRKAYSELRSVANKRLNRLQEQDLNMTARTGYRFPTISSIEESSKATVASELADVSKFLREPRTTVKGEKAFLVQFRDMMTDKGYESLVRTKEDIYATLKFLDDVRDTHIEVQIKPSDIMDVLQEGERLNIPTDMLLKNIDFLTDNLDRLMDVEPTKGSRKFSTSRMNALIRKWENEHQEHRNV